MLLRRYLTPLGNATGFMRRQHSNDVLPLTAKNSEDVRLTELLCDPLILAVMRSYGTNSDEIISIFDTLRQRRAERA